METGREVAISYTISEDVAIACAPTATRTRDLLLRRHFRSVPGRCWMWPDVPFDRSGNGWRWPGAALRLRSLAPRLAPRGLVSNTNVRMPGSRFGHWILSRRPASTEREAASVAWDDARGMAPGGGPREAAQRAGRRRHSRANYSGKTRHMSRIRCKKEDQLSPDSGEGPSASVSEATVVANESGHCHRF